MPAANPPIAEQPSLPEGKLVHLTVNDLRRSAHNPRKLFDPKPLAALRSSIREHGVLVPLTVYRLPGQALYSIIDGERRYRCCLELAEAGYDIRIPANVVSSPDGTTSLIHMFNIHQYREQWELMPTAIALQSLIDQLAADDAGDLTTLTGLSDRQLDRCKVILSFPRKYQQLSMAADRKDRIPSNFWIELHPVLQLTELLLPDVVADEGRDGITDRLVAKYRAKHIKSVIHFRRIIEAHEVQEEAGEVELVADKLREYVLNITLETRAAFDEFIAERRRLTKATDAIDKFISTMTKAKIDYAIDDKDAIVERLLAVRIFVEGLLGRMEGDDPPAEEAG